MKVHTTIHTRGFLPRKFYIPTQAHVLFTDFTNTNVFFIYINVHKCIQFIFMSNSFCNQNIVKISKGMH